MSNAQAITFTPEQVAEHLGGLEETARTIDALIADGKRTELQVEEMDRHIRHIGIMCAKSHLQGNDLAPFRAAADRGQAWMLSSDV